ncbi:hypothetical protein [Mesobacterium pallidum]|uniref:hypothetical protein n=1 Tax=Mesobacterium pallidum TaxID=2872037 RepID=UPI001EE1D13D|nr:hypothetical protein [Mesobacterium pallidum]
MVRTPFFLVLTALSGLGLPTMAGALPGLPGSGPEARLRLAAYPLPPGLEAAPAAAGRGVARL